MQRDSSTEPRFPDIRNERLECRASQGRAVGILLLNCLMIAVSFACTLLDSTRAQFAGWIGMAFFSLCLPITIRETFRKGVVVIFDDEGFEDVRLGTGKIPWRDVEAVVVVRVRSSRTFCVRLYDEPGYTSRMPLMRRLHSAMNKAMNFPALWVNFASTDRGMDEALDYIRSLNPPVHVAE